MSHLLKHALIGLALTVVFFSTAASLQATPLVITVTNAVQTVAPGGTVIFSGTVFNPNNQVFSITNVTINNLSPGFFAAVAGAGIPPGFPQNPVPALATVSGNFFFITFSTTAAPGTYTGTLFLTGNIPNGASENSNLVPISVTVLARNAPVPEPTTMLLLGTGLLGIGIKVRKRRKDTGNTEQ